VSLLDSGPDEVTVYPDVNAQTDEANVETDEYGNEIVVPESSGVTVRGRWQPSTAAESADLGQQTSTVYRFISRDFPAGPYARVEFDDAEWDVIAEPKRHRGSSTTRHVTTFLKER
jgi:hypothetical protein